MKWIPLNQKMPDDGWRIIRYNDGRISMCYFVVNSAMPKNVVEYLDDGIDRTPKTFNDFLKETRKVVNALNDHLTKYENLKENK